MLEAKSNAAQAPSSTPSELYIPPIGQSAASPLYQGDLNDHEQYQAYTDARERALKQEFIAAVQTKVEKLEALLERGRAEGISQDELDFAVEKINGLKAMRQKIQQELLDTQ